MTEREPGRSGLRASAVGPGRMSMSDFYDPKKRNDDESVRDPEKPGRYTLIERWTGLAPLRRRLGKDHTKEIQAVFGELGATPRTTESFAPIDGRK
jgi:hypothetical protein